MQTLLKVKKNAHTPHAGSASCLFPPKPSARDQKAILGFASSGNSDPFKEDSREGGLGHIF